MNNGNHQYTPLDRTYAEALLGAAREQHSLTRTREEAQLVLDAVAQTPRLLLFLESPQVKLEQKLGLLDRAFRDRLGLLLVNLLHMLVARRRVAALGSILHLFLELAEEAEGIYPAAVHTAVELAPPEKTKLQAALERYARCRLRIDFMVDPGLLGGVVFHFRDQLVDGSLRNGLAELRRQMLQTTLAAQRG